jgi:hypothetical protein
MAVHKGSEGTVKVGVNAIAEIRSYSIEETSDTLETTTWVIRLAHTHLT